jgi:hypothetical protein
MLCQRLRANLILWRGVLAPVVESVPRKEAAIERRTTLALPSDSLLQGSMDRPFQAM